MDSEYTDVSDVEATEEIIVDVEPTNERVYETQPAQTGYQYQQPTHYASSGIPAVNPTKGLMTAALVCGICAVVFPLLPILSLFTVPVAIAAIVLGMNARKRTPEGFPTGMATAAIILGALGILAFILLVIASIWLASQPGFMDFYNDLLGTNF